jgi:hypothetical protein
VVTESPRWSRAYAFSIGCLTSSSAFMPKINVVFA